MATPQITNLGMLPGGTYSIATAVSADGRVVVGNGDARGAGGTSVAWRWTAAGGFEELAALSNQGWPQPPGIEPRDEPVQQFANRISADGSTIVGNANARPWSTAGFVWNRSGGTQFLNAPQVADGGVVRQLDMTSDGSVIVGATYTDLFRWTPATGTQALASPFGNSYPAVFRVNQAGEFSAAATIDEDGTYRWTPGGGATLIGDFSPRVMTSDGRVIAGERNAALTTATVVVWEEGFGLHEIAPLPGHIGAYSSVLDPSGRALFGSSTGGTDVPFQDETPFIWTRESGAASFEALLRSQGVDLSGWRLARVTGVGDDLGTVVGVGAYLGEYQAFVITGFQIPTTGTGGMLCMAMVLSARRRRA
ncbi:MAG: hypothetical protein K2X32_15620 [Phycisphaerales bacterium]|nr:hypothetical protein [Phycisphaerales bacterium]